MVAMHIDNMRFLSYSMIFLEYITMNVGHLARYADLVADEVGAFWIISLSLAKFFSWIFESSYKL